MGSTLKVSKAVFIPRTCAMPRFNFKALACGKSLLIVTWLYFFYLSLCCVYWPSENRKKELLAFIKNSKSYKHSQHDLASLSSQSNYSELVFLSTSYLHCTPHLYIVYWFLYSLQDCSGYCVVKILLCCTPEVRDKKVLFEPL